MHIVNDRPLISLNDEPNDLAVITPSAFLGQGLAPNTPPSAFYDRGDLCREYLYNTTLANKFLECKVTSLLYKVETSGGYLEMISALKNWAWLEMLKTSQGVGLCLSRVHRVQPQWRNGKELVRRATLAGLKDCGDDTNKIDYIRRDISKIAPV